MTERKAEQIREITFDLATRAEGSTAIPVVLSSDAVVEVADGPEVLMHTPDAIDLQRAPLPIIAGHGSGQINVGIIDNLQVSNGRLRGMATFGARPEARGYAEDVANRIIRSVSVGYARVRAKVRDDGVLVTSRWMPTHAAMVAEPADVNAGFYRTRESVPTFVLEDDTPPPAVITKGASMNDESKTAPATKIITEPEMQAMDPVVYEQERKQGIANLGRLNRVDERCMIDWISRGTSLTQVIKDIGAIQHERDKDLPSVTTIGMDRKEVRRYSIMRAINASASGDWKHAGLELEASQAVMKSANLTARTSRSFFVPMEVQERPVSQQRDALVSGTGGYLVGTSNQGFIDLLRNRMVALQMGVTRLSGLVGNVTIPKQTAGATAYWLASETTGITEGNQTFAQLPLTPNTVGAYTQISRLLQLQSSPDAETIIMRDLAAQVAIAVDLAVIAGTGTEQPTGITGTSGIGTVTGTTFTYATILSFQSDVAAANALTPTCGYVTTPAIAALAMSRPTFTAGYTPIWTGNMLDGQMGGFKAMTSMQIPTAGMLFGDWATVILAEWGVLELAVNPVDNFAQGLTGLRAFYTVDVGVKYAGAWAWGAAMT